MNKIKFYLKKIVADKGIWLTLLLSLVVLLFFFGKIVKHPNQVYFSKDGDGLQSYYTMIYHIKYDSTYSHFQGMNYPYGEHVLFTNCQPVISNTMKFISRNIVDVSDYAVGVINLFMLFSILIAALFLYLILKEFELNWIYSIFIATGIAYLSPLLYRFSGHYSLSYVFTIPVIIYLLIKFYKNPSWKKSLITGLFILMMATFHMYNYAFAAFILGIFWIVQLVSDKKYRKWKFALLNIFLQILLPILVINIWLWLTDNVNDRTSYPWGFLVYKSGWEGVFMEHQTVGNSFLKSFMHPQTVEWEGWAYCGHIASFLFIILFGIIGVIPFLIGAKIEFIIVVFILGLLFHILQKRRWNIFALTSNKLLNIFLWAGLLTLLVSFALPFTLFPDLLQYAGPMKQFRGIGRFAWVFYFTINIGVFYFLYHFKLKRKWLHAIIIIIPLLVLYYDAYRNSRYTSLYLNNEIPLFQKSYQGEKNTDNVIDTEKYQTFIPIPYFHVGSENLWIESRGESMLNAFSFSLQTGLPMTSVQMSRTSISQTYNNVSMVFEPYRPLKILNDYKNSKPLLLLVTKCSELNQRDSILLRKAVLIKPWNGCDLYELSFEAMQHVSDSLYLQALQESKSKKLYNIDGVLSTDSLKTFVYNGFDTMMSGRFYGDPGAFSGDIKKYNTVFEDSIPNASADCDYIMSFWIGKINTDVVPRSTLEFAFCDSVGNVINAEYSGTHRLFSIIDSSWALAEYKFRLKNTHDKIKVTLWNNDILKNDTLFIDNFLIRPLKNDVIWIMNETSVMKNDRFYLANEGVRK